MYNCKDKESDDIPFLDWITPDLDLENELLEKEDVLTILKYESYKRNKTILALLWDLDAKPHEIILLKIKHIRLKEKYNEGEIPYEAKISTGPYFYVISILGDGLNEHPCRNEPKTRLISNLIYGSSITSDRIILISIDEI